MPETIANPDEVWEYDKIDYWEGIDKMFINQINKNSHVIYADGNKSISTSNHLDICSFARSYTSVNEKAKTIVEAIALSPQFFSIGSSLLLSCVDDFSPPYLNTKPNRDGFDKRKEMGKTAAEDFIKKLKEDRISCSKETINGVVKIKGIMDIVAHSMGFAYSLGMIEVLHKEGITLGNYYVIAPENACSGTLPDYLKNTFQYGSNEKDLIQKQDGIAPQCAIQGIKPQNRIFIQIKKGPEEEKGFIQSHKIKNYYWIFDEEITPKGRPGYVIPRN